jgi:hypothetical protein
MPKIKIDTADKYFSLYVRIRDNWTCQRCKRKYKQGDRGITCSHFWSRRHENTRFDLENCDTLCFGCHSLWESDKQGDYRDFKIKQLGEKEYKNLMIRSNLPKKKDRKLDAIIWKKLYKNLINQT